MILEEVKTRLESTESFKLWNKEINLSFNDFDVLDIDNNIKLQEGKKDIGKYSVLIENGKYSAVYDLDNEAVRKHNLKRIGKLINIEILDTPTGYVAVYKDEEAHNLKGRTKEDREIEAAQIFGLDEDLINFEHK